MLKIHKESELENKTKLQHKTITGSGCVEPSLNSLNSMTLRGVIKWAIKLTNKYKY